jgi:endogenous inhibitor of DNA gyrase (YacG/DUF329 family)
MTAKQVFECVSCGAKALQYASQVGKNFYCSKKCYAESLKNKAPHNKGQKNHIIKRCEKCGNEFSGMPSLLRKRKFCSKECANLNLKATAKDQLSKYRIVEDCWLWEGCTRGGYGRLKIDGKMSEAHRASYEYHVGKIPEGLVLDHLCRNRSCINPAHLEPVTTAENIRRGEQGSLDAMKKHWNTRRKTYDANS